MKMKIATKNRLLIAVVALAGTALCTLMLRDTATTHAAMRQQATRSLAQSGKTISEGDAMAYVAGAPYRDGLSQGKLARERGEAGHISAGRWSSQLDRTAHSDGYQQGFGTGAGNAVQK
jgi:hypothetical protein